MPLPDSGWTQLGLGILAVVTSIVTVVRLVVVGLQKNMEALVQSQTEATADNRVVLREMATNLAVQTELLRQMRDESNMDRAAERATSRQRKEP